MEQDKAQVVQYQGLVLKQRDIMLTLTQRLTERDDTVLGLQEELEVYDARVKYVVIVFFGEGGICSMPNNMDCTNAGNWRTHWMPKQHI